MLLNNLGHDVTNIASEIQFHGKNFGRNQRGSFVQAQQPQDEARRCIWNFGVLRNTAGQRERIDEARNATALLRREPTEENE